MRLLYIPLSILLCGILPASSDGQAKTATGITYVHQEKASLKSRFFQRAAALFRVKKRIENKIRKSSYDQKVAPIPKSIRSSLNITKETIKGRSHWRLITPQNSSKKVILYLHGGAYYWNISKYNWIFAEELALKTQSSIIVPDYPLAPHSSYEETYAYIDALYQKLISTYSPDNITVIGESAGGGLALGFAMFLREQKTRQPSQLILLAPWLDVTMTNPDLRSIDKKDKILGIKGLQLAGKGYAGKSDPSNYKVSPINGSLSKLPKISIFVGTHDLLFADARKFKNLALASGIPINYYEYPAMFHIWIFVKKLKEAEHAKKQILSLIIGE